MKSRLISCGLAALTCATLTYAAEPPPKRLQEAQVTITGDYDIFSVTEGFGFVVIVRGWEPNVAAEMQLVGPKGEILDVVPAGHHLKANGNGRIVIYIPYKLHGLYAGTWQAVLSSKNGIHKVDIEIPGGAEEE